MIEIINVSKDSWYKVGEKYKVINVFEFKNLGIVVFRGENLCDGIVLHGDYKYIDN